MEKTCIELLQKDIEIFRYCTKKAIEHDEVPAIFSNYDFELSNVNIVSSILKRSVKCDLVEEAISVSMDLELSSFQAGEKLLNFIMHNSTLDPISEV